MTTNDNDAPKRSDWFNRGAFGLAGELVVKDPRVAALTGPHYSVFIAAASFVGLGKDCQRDPQVWTSAAAIAQRAKVGVRTAERALPHLCKEGLFEHTGRRITGKDGRAGPVVYRVPVLADAYREQAARSATEAGLSKASSASVAELNKARSAREAEEGTAREAEEGTATVADDPLYPCDPKGAGEEEEEEAFAVAAASASAGATAPAAATKASAELIAKIAELDHCSISHTRRWAEDKLTGREIRDIDAYLRRCQLRGDGPTNWTPPRPAKKASAKPATRSTAKTATNGKAKSSPSKQSSPNTMAKPAKQSSTASPTRAATLLPPSRAERQAPPRQTPRQAPPTPPRRPRGADPAGRRKPSEVAESEWRAIANRVLAGENASQVAVAANVSASAVYMWVAIEKTRPATQDKAAKQISAVTPNNVSSLFGEREATQSRLDSSFRLMR